MRVCILFNTSRYIGRPDIESVYDEVNMVKEALKQLSYDYFLLPVDRSYQWIDRLKERDFDVVFNLCEDFDGNPEGESWVAGILETLSIPYTGSPPTSLSICLDKIKAKILVSFHGIKTPSFFLPNSDNIKFLPLILKPIRCDASLHIEKKNVIYKVEDYFKFLEEVKNLNVEFFAEEYIDGREFNVSIFDDKVIGIGEVVFKTNPKVLTYSSKWNKKSKEYLLTPVIYPAKLDEDKKREIENLSLKVFKILEMRDYGRVDLRMDESGTVYFIEANPNPDVSYNSGFYRALKYAGISYANFVKRLIEKALTRSE
ncbi:MAG: ATP-grasp domain-containing protein [Candidatus Hydrothermales bacterium]